jgi:hypothetical protein
VSDYYYTNRFTHEQEADIHKMKNMWNGSFRTKLYISCHVPLSVNGQFRDIKRVGTEPETL